jgi:hypothetical protein
MPDGIKGEDVRAGILLADDVMHNVQNDLKSLAGEVRYQGLEGKDREEFWGGATKDEYETLKEIAFAMGPKGVNKLESMLKEAMAMKRG